MRPDDSPISQRHSPPPKKLRDSMRICCFSLAVGTLFLLNGVNSLLVAAEPVAEFLQGLRRRGDIDLAIDYIHLCRKGPPFSDDVQPVFLLESGITFAQAILLTTNPDLQESYRQEARTTLKEFVRLSPNHPRSMQGRTILGELLLNDCSELAMERGPKTDEERRKLLREVLAETRDHLQKSCDRYQEMWGQLPVYIPDDQPALRGVKRAIEEALIRSQLNLAQCTFWEAQTWPEGSREADELCAQAGFKFEAIHQRYRSQAGGLIARLWQARCFQEQKTDQGIRIALGIYAELLEHHGDSATIVDLRDRALMFRLICLNTEHRRDHQLVIQEGEVWLDEHPDRAASPLGIAIQWEVCRALEFKANSIGTTEEERLAFLERADQRAYPLTWSRGFYARQAQSLRERIGPALKSAGRTPQGESVPP